MIAKALELRDRMTFVALLCVDMNPVSNQRDERAEGQRYLLRRCGYPCNGVPNIAITKMMADGDPCTNDPYHWGDRTMAVAHTYITDHWNELNDGDVVDVEFILGEVPTKKRSERYEVPLE